MCAILSRVVSYFGWFLRAFFYLRFSNPTIPHTLAIYTRRSTGVESRRFHGEDLLLNISLLFFCKPSVPHSQALEWNQSSSFTFSTFKTQT